MGFIELIGYLLLFIVLFKLLRSVSTGIFHTFIAPMFGFGVNWKELSKWAVVTGATDGIGKAYAEALAKKGFNIVLISRTQEKLDAVAKEIEKLAMVSTKTIAVDFTSGLEIYEIIRKGLQGLEIGVLVNNVGKSYDYPEFFTVIPDGDQAVHDILNANALSCTMMMRLVLPGMAERRSGVIINVSSLSSITCSPLLSVYGGTKVYMDYLSQSLQAEYRNRQIIIQSVLPGFVISKMSKLRKTSVMVPTPKAYVHWALKTVGIESRTAGYPAHKLMAYAMEFLNTYTPSLSLSLTFKSLFGLRRGHYRKFKLDDTFCAGAKMSKRE